jgi:hypothetical protein
VTFLLLLSILRGIVSAQETKSIELGRLESGAVISFVRSTGKIWGIDVAGGEAPRIDQAKPVKIEVFRRLGDIEELSDGYEVIKKTPHGAEAFAVIHYDKNVVFRVRDAWHLTGAVLSLSRVVDVQGSAPGGFYSEIAFDLSHPSGWTDVNFIAPGAIYGDPTYDGDRSPGGTLNYAARHLWMREDILAAPLFALSFKNGSSIAMLDPAPRGDSTEEETKLTEPIMTDARFKFGAMGVWQGQDNTVHFGYRFPGTINEFAGTKNEPAAERSVRRYHPISRGFSQKYQVEFRFGQNESFREVTRDSWRWAWNTLDPSVNYIDVDQMRRILIDHLAAQVEVINGRTGVPFVLSTINGKKNWNWPMVAMGFVGKNLECADQLLREGDRDSLSPESGM